jgi:Tfp pilus assembly protein PilF
MPLCLLETAAELHRIGQLARAEAAYRELLAREPGNADALHLLGVVAHQQSRHGEAIELITRAIELRSDAAPYHHNLGEARRATGDVEAALPHYARAIELRPNYADAHNNLGRALEMLGKPVDARAMYRRAITLEPEHAKAHFNLGLVSLLLGDFTTGWREYEWRWRVPEFAEGHGVPTLPRWDGSDPARQTILVHCEQGLGDCIQFVRYLPLLRGSRANVVLSCPRPLRQLFESLPDVIVVGDDEALPAADVCVPIASLPLMFHTTPATIPPFGAYLRPSAGSLTRWRLKAQPLRAAGEMIVGLAWAGNPAQVEDRWRSLHFSELAPLLEISRMKFVSLQRGEAAAQAKGITDFSNQLEDFDDTAALISQLDLVIAVDTSVAHVAGALGKPIWTLVRFAADWRWSLDAEDSAWYPTMRLFRQETRGDWSGAIADVAKRLRTRGLSLAA